MAESAITEGVDLWEVDLEVSASVREPLERLLSDTERRRAERYRFEVHRRRFIVRRAVLRRLLGRYLGVAPEGVRLEQTELGKPFVRGSPFDFSASSSNDSAVFAFSRARVGADVEEIRTMSDALGIARRFFDQEESVELERIEPARRSEAFLLLWTVKEAVLKAQGFGLTASLRGFRVSGLRGKPIVTFNEPGAAPAAGWGLHRSSDGRRIVAIAVEGALDRLRRFRWRLSGGESEMESL